MRADDRIPVSFATPAAAVAAPATAALVLDWATPEPAGARAVERVRPQRPAHAAACACCTPRVALAEALHRLFLRRARGDVAFFDRVVVAVADAGASAALADPLVAARFRRDAHAAPRDFRCE
jgi:hypothetical protein